MRFSAEFMAKEGAESGLQDRAGNRVGRGFWHMLPQFSCNRVTGNGRHKGCRGPCMRYALDALLYGKESLVRTPCAIIDHFHFGVIHVYFRDATVPT
jgi:hypothetical protein